MTKKPRYKAPPMHRYTAWRRKYGMPDHGAATDETSMAIKPVCLAIQGFVLQTAIKVRRSQLA